MSRRGLLPSRDPLADPEPLVRRVFAYAVYRTGSRDAADDVTGETFVRAVRYRDSFDPRKGTPVDWVVGIARRCIDDAQGARTFSAGDPPDVHAPGDLERDTVDRVTVREALGSLGERDRELVALRYGADLKVRQIAEQLDMNVNAVEVALHRALGRLRPLLSGDAAEAHRVGGL